MAVSEEATGLLPSQHYCVRIGAKQQLRRSTPVEIKQFTTEPVPPDQVSTAFAAPRTDTTARLNGYVNPEGSTLFYRFEYSGDGGETWVALKDHEDIEQSRGARSCSAPPKRSKNGWSKS